MSKAAKKKLDDKVYVKIKKGEKYLIGTCDRLGVVTQGTDEEDLRKNLREAIELSLEGGENLDYGLVERPEIVVEIDEN